MSRSCSQGSLLEAVIETLGMTVMSTGLHGQWTGLDGDTTAVQLCMKIHFSHSFVNIKNIMLALFINIFYWN